MKVWTLKAHKQSFNDAMAENFGITLNNIGMKKHELPSVVRKKGCCWQKGSLVYVRTVKICPDVSFMYIFASSAAMCPRVLLKSRLL